MEGSFVSSWSREHTTANETVTSCSDRTHGLFPGLPSLHTQCPAKDRPHLRASPPSSLGPPRLLLQVTKGLCVVLYPAVPLPQWAKGWGLWSLGSRAAAQSRTASCSGPCQDILSRWPGSTTCGPVTEQAWLLAPHPGGRAGADSCWVEDQPPGTAFPSDRQQLEGSLIPFPCGP